MEPYWWELQPTVFVSDEENERLIKELKESLNDRNVSESHTPTGNIKLS
jgi:hypothetical protein